MHISPYRYEFIYIYVCIHVCILHTNHTYICISSVSLRNVARSFCNCIWYHVNTYIYMCMNAFTYLHININISIYIYTCTRGHQIYKLYEYMHFLRLLTQRGKILMQLYLVPCIYVVYEYICMHDVYVCCICMYMWQDPCAPVFGTMYICCVCMFMRCEILVQLYLVPCICYATGRFGRNTQLCF